MSRDFVSSVAEQLEHHVDFEAFRPVLLKALDYGERPKGGSPPHDPAAMSEILVLASTHNAGVERMEFFIRDRSAWPRFPGFRIGEATPNAKTIWLFRENLVRAGASETLFAAFEKQLRDRGHAPGGGQIMDATLVSAPRQRMTKEERERAKAGESAPEIWPGASAKAAQKDTDARWATGYSKAKKAKDGGKAKDAKDGGKGGGPVDISVPHFGYKNHAGIDRRHGSVRGETCTDATRHDGHEPETVLDKDNSSKSVWADTAYRSAENEAWLEEHGYRSQIHRRKPRGKPMPGNVRRANARRSAVRAGHVFDRRKGPMALAICSIGWTRAAGRTALASLAHDIRHPVFHERRRAAAQPRPESPETTGSSSRAGQIRAKWRPESPVPGPVERARRPAARRRRNQGCSMCPSFHGSECLPRGQGHRIARWYAGRCHDHRRAVLHQERGQGPRPQDVPARKGGQ